MENRSFFRQLRSLVMPIAFAQFMLALVGASDAVMLGMMSQDAMAAVSLLFGTKAGIIRDDK